ncbi:MAG: glycosyltransferase family 39 protein [Candidatus Azobacteroides sp.]|nr:glycosyltransferase family 39 protein [Candidatus Azobacteroides sp.]
MSKKNFILLAFVLLKFFLQYFLISSGYDLHRDEYLYLDQAHHLAWGFMSVPPLTSWVSWLIYILGRTVFWVKFFPALFGALTIVVVWKTVEELNGSLFALILSALCTLFSVLLRINILHQPTSFDILSWTAFYFVLIKYFKTEKTKWLYIAALVFSIGFLNKYNIIFLVIGLLPAILLTRYRNIFAKKELYFAIILGLLFILPNLIWQYMNNFPVIRHLTELTDTQLVHVNRLDFLKDQILFFASAILVIIAAVYALLFYKPFEKYRAFFWAIIFTLTVFMYFRAKDYYSAGLYPVYFAFGSVFLGNILKTGWKKYLQVILILLPVLFFAGIYNVAFPNKSPEYMMNHPQQYQKLGLLRWEDGKEHSLPQDFADMTGWKELAIKVDSVWSELPDPEHTFILCDDYGQAGAINYYTKNKKMVAHSENADYINWLSLDKRIEDIVLVKENYYDKDKDRKREIQFFDTVYLAAQRINQYAREDTISIYVLKGAKVDVNKIIKEEAEEKKK